MASKQRLDSDALHDILRYQAFDSANVHVDMNFTDSDNYEANDAKSSNVDYYYGLSLERSKSAAPSTFNTNRLNEKASSTLFLHSQLSSLPHSGSVGAQSINMSHVSKPYSKPQYESISAINNINSDAGMSSYFFSGASTATNLSSSSRRHFFSTDEDDDDNGQLSDKISDVMMIPEITKRPASTGGIEHKYKTAYNRSDDTDSNVKSILETLGLTSLCSNGDEVDRNGANENPNFSSVNSTMRGNAVVGKTGYSGDNSVSSSIGQRKLFDESDTMIRKEGTTISTSSKTSKYFSSEVDVGLEGSGSPRNEPLFHSNAANYMGGVTASSHQDHIGTFNEKEDFKHSKNEIGISSNGGRVMTYLQPDSSLEQESTSYSQFAKQQRQQPHPKSWYSSNHQQQSLFYNAQQQPSQYLHSQTPYQVQQLNTFQGQQSSLYQVSTPSSSSQHQSFGYGYQHQYQPQKQQLQQQQQQPHIVLQHISNLPTLHHPLNQDEPRYVSVVPIQTSHHQHHASGQTSYAYIPYSSDWSMQFQQPQTSTGLNAPLTTATFLMGPNSQPIALTSVPVGAGSSAYSVGIEPSLSTGGLMRQGGLSGISPPRTPLRGGLGAKSDRRSQIPFSSPLGDGAEGGRGRKGNSIFIPSPRAGGGKRGDKNAAVPSKMGPAAASILNDIRGAKNRNTWTVHDISGHMIEFCLDQNGSRFIQQRLEVADDLEKEAVMNEIIPSIKDLQNDVFGNYVIQKLFEFGNEQIKKSLKETLKGNMVLLSLQMYGCRVIQKAFESLEYQDLCELLQELEQNVLVCIQDQNGNHVMQKCVQVMSVKAKEVEFRSGEADISRTITERIQFIVDDVLANVESLCCHPYGCRVLQRMLEHCVDFQKMATLDKIQLHHKTLLDDQYGNYVIQHVLQYGRDSDRDSLLQIIIENDLLKLSRQKFASNVVENLLKYSNPHQRNALVREMLKTVIDDASNVEGHRCTMLLLMVRDAYANYVVQTALDVVPEGNEKRDLISELRSNEDQLRNYTFAKHIVAKLGVK